MVASTKLTEVPAGTPELRLRMSGKSLKVSPALSEGGNLIWGLIRPNHDKVSGFGVPIPNLADELPTSVVIANPETGDTVELQLKDGPTTYTDKKSGVEKPANKSKVYTGEHTVPGTTASRVFDIKVSVTKNGIWNAKATLRNAGGGGGSAPVLDIFAEDDRYYTEQ